MSLNQISIIEESVPGDVQNRYVSELVHYHIRTLDEHSSATNKFRGLKFIKVSYRVKHAFLIKLDCTIPYFLKAQQVNEDNLNWLVLEWQLEIQHSIY